MKKVAIGTKRSASASTRKTPQRKPAPQTVARKRATKTATAVPELVIQGAGRSSSRISDSLKALATATAKHPGKLAGGLRRAGVELVKVARGRSVVAPAPNDRRF